LHPNLAYCGSTTYRLKADKVINRFGWPGLGLFCQSVRLVERQISPKGDNLRLHDPHHPIAAIDSGGELALSRRENNSGGAWL